MIYQKVVLIGAGRVAHHLAKAINHSGRKIVQVYSRHLGNARELASPHRVAFTDDLSNLDASADIYIIAVSDDAIAGVANQLVVADKMVVHTSGSTPMNVLNPASSNHGVLYPLQSFAFNTDIDFKKVPLCIEAADPKTEENLISFSRSISNDVRRINSDTRLQIHIAAVFANNFTNFMYLMAQEILSEGKVDFDILMPLIEETTRKLKDQQPQEAQTGPARRADIGVIQKHLGHLKDHPEKQEIYKMLSQFIQEHFNQKK
jgi:predicted short-subunit dehydrogenase-like oxidoreductase (DUF2520 family)